jgi:hypothetical protein
LCKSTLAASLETCGETVKLREKSRRRATDERRGAQR